VRVLSLGSPLVTDRGAPIVRALHAGIETLPVEPDVVVNVDADVSMDSDFFSRLLAVFEDQPALGIASGTALELEDGVWRRRFVTGGNARGATRAFRWACLQDVLPFEERVGWDGIDQLRARARGWETRMILDLPFYHHRRVGERDATSFDSWRAAGETAYYVGYRPTYLLLRTLRHVGRNPAALAMLWGYGASAAGRLPRLDDQDARAILREDQRLRNLGRRLRETRGLEEPAG